MQKILYTTLCKKNKSPVDNLFLFKRLMNGEDYFLGSGYL